MTTEEKKKDITGWSVTIGIHALLLLLFLFWKAWQAPDPPIPEYGIELNFGLSNVGSGVEQPETDPISENVSETTNESEPVEETDIEATSESSSESGETVKTTDMASPHSVENSAKSGTKGEANAISKSENNTKPEGEKSSESASSSTSSHGDDKDKVGDKGDKTGSVDSRSLYGSPGTGSGSSLDMAGWVWDFKPKPDDTSDESGRVVFEVKIDDQGEILSVRTLEKTVSPAVEKIYKREVERLTFSRTADNSVAAPMSTGRITFIIRSK